MELPDLNRIVDTYIPVANGDIVVYWDQLRRDVLPYVRTLQFDQQLRWFSFLLHGANMLGGREPEDSRLFIHLRLEPATGLTPEQFIRLLPAHFQNPQQVALGEIAGVDGSILRDDEWAHAWRIHGEASAWVLRLLEGHGDGDAISLQQVVQVLHFVTNPLGLGHHCELRVNKGVISF